MAVHVVSFSESDYPEWEALVAEAPGGSIYSLPRYLDALCAVGGGQYRILGIRRGDALVGGVALYERTSRAGRFVEPRLLLYYNGIVLRSYGTKYPSEETGRHVEAMSALAEAIETRRYAAVALRSRAPVQDVRPFLTRGWKGLPSYTYVVPIADRAALWDRIEPNLRRLIRRCERDGMTLATDDDFGDFYRLHVATLGRKGVATYLPEAAFSAFYGRLASAQLARIFHVRLADGRAAASQLVLLGPHRVTHTVSAAGDPELNRLGGQALLRWKVFEELAARGYHANDLTDASLNPVTHFKAQLGGHLTLTLELRSPATRLFALGRATTRAGWAARERAGTLVRRALRTAGITYHGR